MACPYTMTHRAAAELGLINGASDAGLAHVRCWRELTYNGSTRRLLVGTRN